MKRREWLPPLLIGLVLLLVSPSIACQWLLPSPTPPVSPPSQPPPVTKSKPPEQLPPVDEAADEEEWSTIETFAGEGDETTKPFHISGAKWRVTWAVDAIYPEYGAFNLFVYPSDTQSTFTRRISHSGGSTTDTSYIHDGGQDYYLKVIASGLRGWTIVVEDYATEAYLSPVQITRINYKGRGTLKSMEMGYKTIEADEYVEIKNKSDCWQVISGWTLKNVTKGCPSFTLPIHLPSDTLPRPWALPPRHSIRIYTGAIHEDDELYDEYHESGGLHFYYFPGDIWDNEEPDVAVLYNSKREEVSRRSYAIPVENKVSANE